MRGRRHEYSQRDLINAGKEYFSKHGITTTTEYKRYKSSEMPSVSTIYNHFESWNEFLKECGYDANYVRFSKEEVTLFIEEYYRKHKRPPMLKKIDCASSINTHFGNFNNCLESVLGIKIRQYNNEHEKLKCAALKVIATFYRENKRFPTVTEWRKKGFSPASSQLHRNGIHIPDLIKEVRAIELSERNKIISRT